MRVDRYFALCGIVSKNNGGRAGTIPKLARASKVPSLILPAVLGTSMYRIPAFCGVANGLG